MIELDKISFIRNERFILKDISLSINKGEKWVILGKNGSGKTTLINILFGYLWPTKGKVKVLGKSYGAFPLSEVQKKIGILQGTFQEERLQRNLSIKDILSTGVLNSIGIYSELSLKEKEKLESLIATNSWIKNPNQSYSLLSSGEKKKILLLRALISEPEILILDEPCSSLDLAAREDFYSLLNNYKDQGQCMILITHRTDEIPDYFNYALLLKNGEIVQAGTKNKVFTSENLSKTYEIEVELIEQKGQYFTKVLKK